MPKVGRIAMKSKMTPIPPIHCVKLLHRSMLRSTCSKLSITDEPVVVKPDMDSKKASIGPNVAEKMYGREPNIAIKSHPKATIAKPSLRFISPFRTPTFRSKIMPKMIVIASGSIHVLIRKGEGYTISSPYQIATLSGKNH